MHKFILLLSLVISQLSLGAAASSSDAAASAAGKQRREQGPNNKSIKHRRKQRNKRCNCHQISIKKNLKTI